MTARDRFLGHSSLVGLARTELAITRLTSQSIFYHELDMKSSKPFGLTNDGAAIEINDWIALLAHELTSL